MQIIHRKERIVFTAIEVIHELGVMALSTKKIAEYEDIAESTVYKHFENKNAILLSVLNFYAKFDQDLIETIEMNRLTGLKAIYFYLETYVTYYENYPAITAITQGLDEMRRIEALSKRVEAIDLYRRRALTNLVKSAQAISEIEARFSADLISEVIHSYCIGIICYWRSSGYAFDLKKRILEATDFCFRSGQ